MKAHILSVGTELLLGDIVNTNAQFLSRELARYGVFVYSQSVVGDNEDRLTQSIADAFDKGVDIIVTTGGLGPTKDDLTKEVAAKYFGLEMSLNEEIAEEIKAFFVKQRLELVEGNMKQAMIPKGAVIMDNPHGTAPGVILEKDGKAVILLPGPPRECVPMFNDHVAPYLAKRQEATMVSRTLRLCGIGESMAAEAVSELLDNENPTVAPYAKQTECHLRITARAKTEDEAKEIMRPVAEEIYKRLGKHIYGENETELSDAIVALLAEKRLTLAVAESCTGGLLAARLVNTPGVSRVFLEGVVTYSDEAKASRLGVKRETLEKHGAVSYETAHEMAEGIVETAGSDVGIAITGIAGPGGGSAEKPVGLVYIALCVSGRTMVREYNILGGRERVRARAVTNALTLLWQELMSV